MKAKVIKTERDYKSAMAYLERLLSAPTPDEDELELWSLLVEKYEEEHFPIATPDPIEAIRFRMEQAGLQPADLNPYLQSKSKVSEVMNRKRPLSLSMIRALHRGLNIPAEVLVQETQAPYGAKTRSKLQAVTTSANKISAAQAAVEEARAAKKK